MRTTNAAPPPGRTAYVVLVNWNGWRDTIECLESLFRSDYAAYRVVVCDNASADGSLERIQRWAAGRELAAHTPPRPLARLVEPPIEKPLSCVLLRGPDPADWRGSADARLVLIDTGANLGFAGGCNVGIRYALHQEDCGYIWLLNNDTVVDPGALSALVRRSASRPDAGQIGSRLLFYHSSETVQALGGERYNRWLSRAHQIGAGQSVHDPVSTGEIERQMSYVSGASLFVTREFVSTVGLMEESYFLYFEEMDWAARAAGRFGLAYAHDSIVYHKEGQSIGSGREVRRSALADYFSVRNRIRFTRRFFPEALLTVVLGVVLAIVNRLRRRQPAMAMAIVRILLSPSTYSLEAGESPGAALARYSRTKDARREA